MTNQKDQDAASPADAAEVTRLGGLTSSGHALPPAFPTDRDSSATMLSGAPDNSDATQLSGTLGDVRFSGTSGEAADGDRTQLARAAAGSANERSKIGLVLNHIWTVRRLIAQGGMGEVYEGVETNTGEPVAIKFLLPRFVADSTIKELFLSEARNFVRLSKAHPALVQYRVCAEDPRIGEIYIVMELIDGPPLADVLGSLHPTPRDIAEFIRLIASALAVAHQSRLVHRDLSPKNILLPQRDLRRAKIIDFGIAKDTASGEGTIYGGFKGNLGYCAPEQFDEGAGGETPGIGPWTDVYGLGLVILALAGGKPPGMGNTLADAVERRKRVPDLSAVPKEIRPLLADMLAPAVAKRLKSMDAVLAALDTIAPAATPKRSALPWTAAAAAVLVVAAAGAFFLRPQNVSEQQVRQNVASALAASDCTWLNLDSFTSNASTAHAKLSGAAGDIRAATAAAQRAAGVPVEFDIAEVFRLAPQACGPLNALRRFREPASAAGVSLAVQQRQFRLQNDPRFCAADKIRKARVTANLRLDSASTDFTLLGLEPNGRMEQLIQDRKHFDDARATSPDFAPNLGGNIYTMSFCVDEATAARSNGQVGLIMVKGTGPFALGLDPNASDSVSVPADWPERFTQAAVAQHWATQIAWYQVVSE
jgi:eukaryotic-like serine/threonine-protein kinase